MVAVVGMSGLRGLPRHRPIDTSVTIRTGLQQKRAIVPRVSKATSTLTNLRLTNALLKSDHEDGSAYSLSSDPLPSYPLAEEGLGRSGDRKGAARPTTG